MKAGLKISRVAGAALLLVAAWVAVNTFPLWRDFVSGPPVEFLRDRNVELELYPRAHRSAFILTNDDLHSFTPPAAIERLRAGLQRMAIPCTFFVIPYHYGRAELEPDSPQAEAMGRLRADGHEIAQHGWRHYCPAGAARGRAGAEFLYVGLEEQKARLAAGRRILKDLGFAPLGHRSPTFGANRLFFRALEEAGYLYGSDVSYPPRTPQTFLLPGRARRVLYPFRPRGMNHLQFVCQIDPVVRPEKAARLFQTYHARRGIFTVLTHLPELAEPENLARLEEFIAEVRVFDPWFTTLEEAARWWTAREKVAVKSVRGRDSIVVTVENTTSYPLPGAVINFSAALPVGKRYSIGSGDGSVLSKGSIPPGRRVEVDIPPGIRPAVAGSGRR